MAMNTIITRLGLDSTAFRRGMVTAEKDLQRFQTRLSRLGFGAVGIGLVGALFREMLQDARNAEGQLTETQRALQGLGEGLDALRNGAKAALGEIVKLASGAIQATTNWTASLFLGREEVAARVRESERALEIERQIAEWAKKSEEIARERASIEQQLTRASEANAAFALSQLSLEEQLEAAIKAQQEAADELVNARQNSNDLLRAQVRLEETSLIRARAAAALRREQIAQEQQQLRAQQSAAEALQRRRASLNQQQRDFELEQLRRQDRILRLEREREGVSRMSIRSAADQVTQQEKLLDLNRELFRLKQEQTREDQRASDQLSEAQEKLAQAQRDLREAARASVQADIGQVAAGERGTGRDRSLAQRIEREQDRRQRLADQLARQQQAGARPEQQERTAEAIRESFRREQELRGQFSTAVREDAKVMFEEQRKAVEEAKRQVSLAEKLVNETKLVREAVEKL